MAVFWFPFIIIIIILGKPKRFLNVREISREFTLKNEYLQKRDISL